MEVSRKNFPKIMRDNDEVYFSHLQGIICSVDEYASMEIVKMDDKYHFRLIPSIPKYTQLLLKSILEFNNLYGIRIEMSKSIKIASTITFNIYIDNDN